MDAGCGAPTFVEALRCPRGVDAVLYHGVVAAVRVPEVELKGQHLHSSTYIMHSSRWHSGQGWVCGHPAGNCKMLICKLLASVLMSVHAALIGCHGQLRSSELLRNHGCICCWG
jgi:hypothetical protein